MLLLLLGAVCVIRLRLLDRPLDRDEGEYAYGGQLMLAGIPPYKLAYNMKLPGTYAAYAAAFAVFGESIQAVHLGLLLANLATIVLVALIGKRLFGGTGGVCAGVVYALLSCMPNVPGLSADAEHFVMLAAVAGLWLLLQARESRKWLLAASGLCMGAAFVMKQPGAAFVGFGFAYLIAKRARWTAISVYTAAAAAPIAGSCLLLWRAQVFEKFWFWTVSYGSQYGSIMTPGMGLLKLMGMLPQVVGPALLIWGMAALGLKFGSLPEKFLLGGWFLASAAAVFGGTLFSQPLLSHAAPGGGAVVWGRGYKLDSPGKAAIRDHRNHGRMFLARDLLCGLFSPAHSTAGCSCYFSGEPFSGGSSAGELLARAQFSRR